jgi:hypothetical protein
VVAEQLVGGLLVALEPARDALVQVRAQVLGQALVRRLPDQRMREAERVVAGVRGNVGADQLAADERRELPVEPVAQRVGHEFGQRGAVEAATLDRRALERRPLAGLEPVDARGEHRVDARRQRLLGADRHQLFHEQWVALGRRGDSRGRLRRAQLAGELFSLAGG